MDFDALPSPLWVLGTGTGVGKTHLAAAIARAWARRGAVTYRKPFQTGVTGPEDPEADAAALALPGVRTETGVMFRAPLSPRAAAAREGRPVNLEALAAWCLRPAEGRLLLEGVGGLMVPLAPRTHFLAWATDLRLPCVLVGLGGLGTLNHTLLSAEALMLRGWRVEAIVLNPGADGTAPEVAEENARLLAEFLPVPVEVLAVAQP